MGWPRFTGPLAEVETVGGGRRVLVMVHTTSLPAATVTDNDVPVPEVPLSQEIDDVYLPSDVEVPAVSPTVCDEPPTTACAPVVPPSPTLAPVPAVALSIWRLNLPGSVLGTSVF